MGESLVVAGRRLSIRVVPGGQEKLSAAEVGRIVNAFRGVA
jgi:hypothetical protein